MHRKFVISFPITQEVIHLPLSLHSSTSSLELPMGRQWAARTKLKNQQENNKNVSLRCSKPVTSRKNETFFFRNFSVLKKSFTCRWPAVGLPAVGGEWYTRNDTPFFRQGWCLPSANKYFSEMFSGVLRVFCHFSQCFSWNFAENKLRLFEN